MCNIFKDIKSPAKLGRLPKIKMKITSPLGKYHTTKDCVCVGVGVGVGVCVCVLRVNSSF